LSSNSN
jgi:hypothetical protein